MNTAIEADDGNPALRERARKALGKWRHLLVSVVTEGIKRKEIRREIDAKELATLTISSLEGALMISRLERNHEALRAAQCHLERYLEEQVRVGNAMKS